jgi:two-component system, NtrC family, sensor kinase
MKFKNPLNLINNFSEVNTELIDEPEQEIDKGNIDEIK